MHNTLLWRRNCLCFSALKFKVATKIFSKQKKQIFEYDIFLKKFELQRSILQTIIQESHLSGIFYWGDIKKWSQLAGVPLIQGPS